VTAQTGEVIEYPLVRYDDLTVDPVYKDLQRQGPIRVQLPYGQPCWLATSYDDVKTVYGDRRFSKESGVGRDTPRMMSNRIAEDPSIIANMDGPRHARVRRLTLAAFSAHQVRSLRPWTEGLIDDVIDDMFAHPKPADFVDLISWAIPLRVITGILGVPGDQIPMFRGWVDTLMDFGSPEGDKAHAIENLMQYIRGLIAERRAGHADDLLAIMVRARDDDDRLSEDELVNVALTLFLAGFETTAAQLGSTVFVLMTHRHLWQELLEDPSLLPAALEELWRWIPSFRFGMPMIRWATEDVELSNGVVIPAGQPVLPEHQVANRDELVFPHAWELDFHRVDPQPNLSLAWGAHRCLGAHLAHLEVEVAVDKLLRRIPTLELAVAAEDVPWASTTFLRSPEKLPLTW
jgi:cytochrome P450